MRETRQNLPFHEFRHAVHEQQRAEGNADRYALGRVAEHGQKKGDEKKDRLFHVSLHDPENGLPGVCLTFRAR